MMQNIGLGLMIVIGIVSSAEAQQADLILTNGRVHTADAARPHRIVFVGSAHEAATLRATNTRVHRSRRQDGHEIIERVQQRAAQAPGAALVRSSTMQMHHELEPQ